jgi:hypothetical protein
MPSASGGRGLFRLGAASAVPGGEGGAEVGLCGRENGRDGSRKGSSFSWTCGGDPEVVRVVSMREGR